MKRGSQERRETDTSESEGLGVFEEEKCEEEYVCFCMNSMLKAKKIRECLRDAVRNIGTFNKKISKNTKQKLTR